MNKRKIYKIYSVLFLLGLFLPLALLAKAETGRNTNDKKFVCVESQEYTIVEPGDMVVINTGFITKKDIDAGYLDINGAKDENGVVKPEYRFKGVPTGSKCIRKDENLSIGFYGWENCPRDVDRKGFTPIDQINTQSKIVESGSGYILQLRGVKGLKFKVSHDVNSNFDPDSYDLYPTNGSYDLNLPRGIEYYISFALDSGDCAGSYVGYIQGVTPNVSTNPYYYNGTRTDNNKVCADYMEKHITDPFARSLVPTCSMEQYNPTTVGDVLAKINSEIANANNIITGLAANENNEHIKLQCDFVPSNNNSDVYVHTEILRGSSSKYWYATCSESIHVRYDAPKAVHAGGGFGYEVDLEVVRTCTPHEIRQPARKDTCTYGIECYGGPHNYDGSTGAGPTEDFDQCIIDTDGGEYTQKAIDKCYEEVYKDSFLSKTKKNNVKKQNSNKTFELRQIRSFKNQGDLADWYAEIRKGRTDGKSDATSTLRDCKIGSKNYTKLPLSSCNYIADNRTCDTSTANVWGTLICHSEHGVGVGFHDVCNSTDGRQTRCYEVFTSSPDCSKNADIDYKKELDVYKSEYDSVLNAIKTFENKEEEKLTIKSADLKKQLVYGEKDNFLVKNDKDVKIQTNNLETITLGHVTINKQSFQVVRKINLKLSRAYVSSIQLGDIVYGTIPRNIEEYYDGGHKYYTGVNEKPVNLVSRWASLIGENAPNAIKSNDKNLVKNILVRLSNYGTWNQWKNIDVDCFYGISQSFITCDPSKEVCDNESGPGRDDGIGPQNEFIFRPIDLIDMFPNNRNPRYNWTDNSISPMFDRKLPSAVIEDIEYKGESIYIDDSEIDYHFKLTPNQIREIRRYNARKQSYLDYDMYCTKTNVNMTSCGSSFIDNGNYVETLKKGLLGCNNQKGVGANAVCVDNYFGGTR